MPVKLVWSNPDKPPKQEPLWQKMPGPALEQPPPQAPDIAWDEEIVAEADVFKNLLLNDLEWPSY